MMINNLKGVMFDGRKIDVWCPKRFCWSFCDVSLFDGGHSEVGHELKTSSGWSPVIASLHSDAQARVLQSKHQHILTTTYGVGRKKY